MDPLAVLRDYAARGDLDKIIFSGDDILFGSDYSFPAATPTAFTSNQSGRPYPLSAAVFLAQHHDLKNIGLIQAARLHRIPPVSLPDRKPFLHFLHFGQNSLPGADPLFPSFPASKEPNLHPPSADLAQLLPGDALEDILRRLPPRGLAVSRCVCRAWRDAVDGGRLLRADLLPLKLAALVINYPDGSLPEYLSRPTTGPVVSGKLDFLPNPKLLWSQIQDHCNGLLLLYHCVVNPATRRWAPLPPLPRAATPCFYRNRSVFYHNRSVFHHNQYLVFDPTVSLHYEVFQFPIIRHRNQLQILYHSNFINKLDPAVEKLDWPPSPWVLQVFSSRTGQWEERSFLREGDAPGTVSDVRMTNRHCGHQAVYWRDWLYVRCQSNFVIRASLSSDKYQTIKLPTLVQISKGYDLLHMGGSENGVYCALFDASCQLFVWILDESSSGDMKWVLKHQSDLNKLVITCLSDNLETNTLGPWVLQDVNYFEQHAEEDYAGRQAEHNFDWNSDDDDVLDDDGTVSRCDDDHGLFTILGFHPFKEVLFMSYKMRKGFAYHLGNSNVQFLGDLQPKASSRIDSYPGFQHLCMKESFPYTPCWVDELPESVDLEACFL